ncbi:MAG: EamA family transporter [Candidatus Korobacteraceae bacterium]
MPQPSRSKIVLAFLLVYFFWGSTYLGIGIAIRYVAPEVMAGTRFTIAGLLMMAWCWWSGRRLRISRGEAVRLVVIGVLLLCIANLILAYAEEVIPTGLAALIVSVTPLWFLMIETWILRNERMTWRGTIGLPLGLAGIVVLLWPKLTAATGVGWRELGASFSLLLGSLSFAIGSVLSREWKVRLDPFSASAWQMLFAGVINLALGVAFSRFAHSNWAFEGIAAIAYLITFGSLVGFSAYIWLLQHVPTSKVATYAYVNPVVAVFLGWLILNERVDGYVLAGTAIVAGSVALTTTAKVKVRTKGGEVEKPLELPAVESTG